MNTMDPMSLTDKERRLLAHVYASLKESIRDELKYHLTHTFPEMRLEVERQYARFYETDTGWPLARCEHTDPPAPVAPPDDVEDF